jgi:probable rRNA maturation factor
MKKVYRAAMRHFKQRDVFSVELTIVSGDDIKKINAETRNVDSVTDVLSFPNLDINQLPKKKKDYPMDIDFDTNRVILGEIVICYDRILEQAKEYGHSEEREAAYLTLHGILHLLGFDHMDEQDKAVMRKHEEEILNKLGIKRD